MPRWLGEFSGSAQAVAETMLAVSGLIGGILLPAALVGRRFPDGAAAWTDRETEDSAAPGMAEFASSVLEVESEIRSALREFEAHCARRPLRLEIGLEPGLQLRADRRALRSALRSLIDHGLSQANSRLLVSASRHGGRVQICVTDDGAGTDRALQQSRLRDAERMIALQGGTIEVRTRSGAGTTVVLRMAEPVIGSAACRLPSRPPPLRPRIRPPQPNASSPRHRGYSQVRRVSCPYAGQAPEPRP